MSYARCQVTIHMKKPADGQIAVQLLRGDLIQSFNPTMLPWFCLTTDVRLGVGTTVVTDAECCEPGRVGNIGDGCLVAVAGHSVDAISVSNTAASGGADEPVPVVQDAPGTMPVLHLGAEADDGWSARNEIAALIRINLGRIEAQAPVRLDTIHRAMNEERSAFVIADTYGSVARALLADRTGRPVLALGFHKAKLVYLSSGIDPSINLMPSGHGRLFLPSEGIKMLPSGG